MPTGNTSAKPPAAAEWLIVTPCCGPSLTPEDARLLLEAARDLLGALRRALTRFRKAATPWPAFTSSPPPSAS